jgi:hypothetical protein
VQEIFAKDAHEIMQIMVQHFKAGFAADDQTREYIHEAFHVGDQLRINISLTFSNWDLTGYQLLISCG